MLPESLHGCFNLVVHIQVERSFEKAGSDHKVTLTMQLKLCMHLADTECSRQYIERIELARHNTVVANSILAQEAGEQGRLNEIMPTLAFDDVTTERDE